ncbi:MAG: hypothetical protein IPI00_07090 [Flavobacteriales bacterium]|nr:hypothetical protein [Flavobacteriales bacterium]MBK6943720.1 hypothetical protein [Flavobacteriales bacterium]MBK7239932.1 hypothetical protein [Flavobacteriales bacterium]MBK7296979.1 hypothetical protein [Flavobacteriales bacterium]MBK9535748.1 hypothetical protein [Flavobacteriales bacterium]
MSFRADLTIDDRTYRVLSCTHTLLTPVDPPSGRPTGRTRGGTVTIEIESTDDIFLWMKIAHLAVAGEQVFDGEVVFRKVEEDVRMRTLKFKDAMVAEHTETYNATDKTPMTIKFSLTARRLIMEGTSESGEFANEWST